MDLYNILNELNISYEEISHKALFTIKDAIDENITSKIDGVECKNLFVKGKDKFYLIFIEAKKRADLKYLASLVNEKKLFFASEEELYNILGLNRGSVTPLGIINDSSNLVKLLFDRDLYNSKVLMHPNVNSKTLSMEFSDLIRIVEYTNHDYLLF